MPTMNNEVEKFESDVNESPGVATCKLQWKTWQSEINKKPYQDEEVRKLQNALLCHHPQVYRAITIWLTFATSLGRSNLLLSPLPRSQSAWELLSGLGHSRLADWLASPLIPHCVTLIYQISPQSSVPFVATRP